MLPEALNKYFVDVYEGVLSVTVIQILHSSHTQCFQIILFHLNIKKEHLLSPCILSEDPGWMFFFFFNALQIYIKKHCDGFTPVATPANTFTFWLLTAQRFLLHYYFSSQYLWAGSNPSLNSACSLI